MEKFKNALKILLIWQVCNVLLVISIVIALVSLGAMAGQNMNIENKSSYGIVKSKTITTDIILQIPMTGVLFRNDNQSIWDEKTGAYERVIADLKKARKDPNVKAVLLRVNSPGGAVSACDRLYQIITRFKKETNIPVYAFYESVAASGGVYTTVSADYIFASPTCVTGSIGVIMGGMNLNKLMEKIGIKNQSYQSGDLKDMGNGFRETKKEEKLLLQSLVDELFSRFVDIVVEGRGEKVTREKIIALKGSFFLPTKALENGLIDEIGEFEDMVAKIHADLGKPCGVIGYIQQPPWEKMLNIFGTILPSDFRNRLELKGPLYLFDM